jgi:hypothetical protein
MTFQASIFWYESPINHSILLAGPLEDINCAILITEMSFEPNSFAYAMMNRLEKWKSWISGPMGGNAVNWKTATLSLSHKRRAPGVQARERAAASTALHAQRPTLNISSTIAVSCYKNRTVRMINMQRYIMLRANTLARARLLSLSL